jgi:hypothetical protein
LNVAIIDADLIGRKKHRFPNLCCMKLSSYYKNKGDNVILKTDYNNLDQYDLVTVSKVFTDTLIPNEALNLPNAIYGGTGFYFDKAPSLPYEVEHSMPDYHLYDAWINEKVSEGCDPKDFKEYQDYSIGRLTLGCIRQCKFCVNQNYKKVEHHADLSEFYDKDRKYICLLDDNILAYKDWKVLLTELQSTNKAFKFKNGIDIRCLNDEKAKMLSESKYIGDMTFAFDSINDQNIITEKIEILKKYYTKIFKFYVLCAFDENNKYDEEFWKQDMINTFERIRILMNYRCLPYIMRFNQYENSPYRGMYINLARWCNQPSFFKKKSLREYCIINGLESGCYRYMTEFEKAYPEIAAKYFDIKFPTKDN